jgi:hypothetical protein
MSVPLYLIVKSTGEIYLSLSKPDAIAVSASPAYRVEIQDSIHTGAAAKIATISGNAGAYTITDAAAGEFSNRHARSF